MTSLPTVNASDFQAHLYARMRKSEYAHPTLVVASPETIEESLEAMAHASDRVFTGAYSTSQASEDALLVARISAADVALALRSIVVPSAGGSPVSILNAQDTLSVLRRLTAHPASCLIIDLSEDTKPQDLNILTQFLELGVLRDLDITHLPVLLTGNFQQLPNVFRNKCTALEVVADTPRQSPTP